MAVDRFLGVVAFGYANGMLKFLQCGGNAEREIFNAHQSPIVYVCFNPGMGTLLTVDCANIIKEWDLSMMQFMDPTCTKESEIPESPESCFTSCLVAPALQSNDPQNHGYAFLGTTSGNVYFYSWADHSLCRHMIKRQMVLKKDTPVTSIKCSP